jgi:hypothetical protein
MKGRAMEAAIQPLQNSASVAAADAVGADTDQLPFKETRAQIAQTESKCETLRQGIGTMQRGLEVLAGIVAGINDCGAREKLQRQLDLMNQLLLLRLDQLSSIDRLLQVALDRTRGPR